MTRQIAIKGFRVKNGRVERDPRRLPVNLRLQKQASKRIRPARKGEVR